MSDPTREQESAAKPKAAPKDMASTKQPASKTPAGMEPPKQWNLTTQYTIDLGDVEVGRMTEHRTTLFAIGSQNGPRVQAKVTGEPSIELVRAPMYLPGTVLPYEGGRELVFRFAPKREGRLAGTLELEVLDLPRETHRMRIVGAAHLPLEPTLDEQDRQAEARRQDAKAREAEAKQRRAEDVFIEEDSNRSYPIHKMAARDLVNERDIAKDKLLNVHLKRIQAIGQAEKEIGNFVRRRPTEESPSLLSELAMLALSSVTAGIAGAVVKALAPRIFAITATRVALPKGTAGPLVHVPDELFTALVADSIKQSIKDVGKKTIGGLPRARSKEAAAIASSEPWAEFLKLEYDGLDSNNGVWAAEMTSRLMKLSWPALAAPPGTQAQPAAARAAIAKMKAVGDAAAATEDFAAAAQLDSTVRHWVRYVEESAARTTPLHPASEELVDGLLDVMFDGSQVVPTAPIRFTGARVLGVRKAVVQRIATRPLRELGLAVRAIGAVNPAYKVIVYRSAGGGIDLRDESSGKPEHGARGEWFARRSGVKGRVREADQLAGARRFIDTEIMPLSLILIAPWLGGLENDSAE